MVSHPDLANRPLPSRPAAASVVGTSTSSSRHNSHSQSHSHHHRRHRSGRSHHGGSSAHHHQPLNEFPIFATTGDVEIVIRAGSQERRYLLHRLILAQCSGFFDAGTSEEWSRAHVQAQAQIEGGGANGGGSLAVPEGSEGERGLAIISEDGDGERERERSEGRLALVAQQQQQQQMKTRWRYELDWENREEDEMPILVQKTPSSSGTLFGGGGLHAPQPSTRSKPLAPSQGFFRSMANLTGIQSALHLPSTATIEEPPLDPTIRDYDNLFRIFYNYSPQLNTINIAAAYSECKSLLALADMYDALPVTGPRVDHHLLRFSSRLYKQIAKYPPSYLKLGYLARSRVIFSEALIHVVGQWPAAMPNLVAAGCPDAVLDLIEDKVEDLEDMKARIEAKLFRLSLTTSRGERVGPANAYLDWLAVSLFRQWVVENTTPPPSSILKPLPSNPPSRNNTSTSTGTAASANVHTPTSARAPAVAANTSNGRSAQRASPPPFSLGRTYRLLGSANSQSYLTHDELKKFLKLHPSSGSSDSIYSRDTLKRFERKMDEMKRLAREIVKPLMRNFLELDVRSGGGDDGGGGGGGPEGGGYMLPYLTCTRVEEGDFPWD
ncbi:hypothetical protein AJ80_08796 [Polytolypa hystricis UAMH7299]|uniref:BTB domain-containing protein n=1 Tax=Polytolypa hystricis (strain UAMH7299) TaxID=1447883 RepID=A0A2B7X1A7_POLH7|nr:hypothetical protein AJ80_08796 [Polytolypa hystricis UAMH7299]